MTSAEQGLVSPGASSEGHADPKTRPHISTNLEAEKLQLLERFRRGRLRRLPAGYFEHALMYDPGDVVAPTTRMSFGAAAERALAPNEPKLQPVPSGYGDLDRALKGGFVPGRLYVLAGHAGIGKTALATGIACNAARAGCPVLVLSLELAGPELARRMLEGISGAEADRPGSDAAAAEEAIRTTLGNLGNIPLTIDDAPLFTAWDAEQRITCGDEQKLVILDGVDFMLGCTAAEGRDAELWELMAALGSMARAVKIPLLATYQPPYPARLHGRNVDPWPWREDMPGAVLATADAVLHLHRPAYFDQAADEHEAPVDVLHNRWGRREIAVLRFRRPAWFQSWYPMETVGGSGDRRHDRAPVMPQPAPSGEREDDLR